MSSQYGSLLSLDRANGGKTGGSCTASYSLVSDLHMPSFPLDFVRSKSLSPADTQGEKDYTPPLEGKSIKEFVDIFLKPPWYLFSPLYR